MNPCFRRSDASPGQSPATKDQWEVQLVDSDLKDGYYYTPDMPWPQLGDLLITSGGLKFRVLARTVFINERVITLNGSFTHPRE